MKKSYVNIFTLATLLFLWLAASVSAMPPHPGNTNPSGKERPAVIEEGQTPLYQSLMRSSPAMRASSIATGTVRVLVILADFGADVAAAPPVFPDISHTTGRVFYLFSAIFLILFLLVLKNRGKWVLPAGVLLLTLSSCPSGGGTDYGDPMYFKTDNSVYKGILETNSGLTMKQYYSEMSNNNLTLTFDVVGPYRASKGWQYYGRNDSQGYDLHAGEFVGEAVDLAYYDGVDFSQYDNDGDGTVETVIIVHAGQGEEFYGDEDTIWSHNWKLSSAALSGDGSGSREYSGVTINNYTIQPEYNESPGDATIGVFCHEFGHVLGLPDLYDTSYATNGVGYWSLMAAGSWGGYENGGSIYSGDGTNPAPLLAWERFYTGGIAWITENSADSTGSYTVGDVETDDEFHSITLESTSGEEQYLYLEGKTQQLSKTAGWFVPASGILVTHIHNGVISDYLSDNSVNDGETRVHGVNIVESGDDTSYGTGSLWTGNGNYSDMTFVDGDQPLDSTTSRRNTNYYNTESVISKSGSSGVSVSFTASGFTVE